MSPLLFFIGCIGTRLALTFFAKYSDKNVLRITSFFTGLISIGFLLIYAFGLRKTGIEVGGNLIWWNSLRPIHGALYGIFSIMAYNGDKNSWMILLLDTIIGLTAYLLH
jgi:hypothetical protein